MSVEAINKDHPMRFLYNGAIGVITDDNTLCYMRQRYYDTEIKRFINQDILSGGISDSQSLNRYSYVQGNPINYNDPFGLSPRRILQPYITAMHDLLNVAGIVPGPIGALADMANAALYMFKGNAEMAINYAFRAFVTGIALPAGGTVIGALCGDKKAYKVIMGVTLIGTGLISVANSGWDLVNKM